MKWLFSLALSGLLSLSLAAQPSPQQVRQAGKAVLDATLKKHSSGYQRLLKPLQLGAERFNVVVVPRHLMSDELADLLEMFATPLKGASGSYTWSWSSDELVGESSNPYKVEFGKPRQEKETTVLPVTFSAHSSVSDTRPDSHNTVEWIFATKGQKTVLCDLRNREKKSALKLLRERKEAYENSLRNPSD